MSWDYLSLANDLGISGKLSGEQLHGSCPLHDNNSVNFSLNTRTGAWTCYVGCGPEKGRTFLRLIMLVRNCNAAEAMAWMRGGNREVPLEKITDLLGAALQRMVPEDVFDAGWSAYDYWSGCSSKVMGIPFLQRGFTWDTIRRWEIRYDAAAEAVVIPIHTPVKRFVGVIQRLMQPRGGPKYLYAPAGFRKSDVLFGLPQATPPVIILTEGSLDTIWLSQHGYPALSVLGDSLSSEQATVLQRGGYSEILLGFDNDVAGLTATEKALSTLIDHGWLLSNIFWVRWPEEISELTGNRIKDANDCSPAQLAKAIEARERLI